jgi:hypothetical protein
MSATQYAAQPIRKLIKNKSINYQLSKGAQRKKKYIFHGMELDN